MGKVFVFILMESEIKECGKIVLSKDEGTYYCKMEIFMKECGKTINGNG